MEEHLKKLISSIQKNVVLEKDYLEIYNDYLNNFNKIIVIDDNLNFKQKEFWDKALLGIKAEITMYTYSDFLVYFNELKKNDKKINSVDTIILIGELKTKDFYSEVFVKGPGLRKKLNKTNTVIGATFVNTDFYQRNIRLSKFSDLAKNVLPAYALFEDELSKKIFYRLVIRHILGGRMCLADLCTFDQYFPPEIVSRLNDNEVFLDCGASIGDSALPFIDIVHNKFKSIYSFEIDKIRYNRFINNPKLSSDRIKCFNFGVDSESKDISYHNDNSPSYVLSQKSEDVGICHVEAIDNLVEKKVISNDVSFIKMDIEGAEVGALLGARKTIMKNKPKMAICVYHKFEDLYKIPCLIKEIEPSYKLILRQHEEWPCETVCYAFT